MWSDAIFDRAGSSEITREAYIRMIALFTLVEGFCVAAGVRFTVSLAPSWMLFIISFAVSIGCIMLFTKSDDPMVSAIGVTGMSLALGAMMGPVVMLYPKQVVAEAVVLTAVVMVTMSVVGIMFPAVFRGWGPYVLGGLTLLIIAQFAQLFCVMAGVQAAVHIPLLTWAGIILFLGIVAFDWSRALDMPYTWDNAIDASGGMILDAVNIFIRILELLGSRSSSRD